jgi:hypothetical protein
MKRIPATFLAGIVLLACRVGGHESATVVSDSAGIRIVTNTRPTWSPDSAWDVDSLPLVVYGRETEDSVSMLMNPIGAVRLSDGRVVVGDRGSKSLKVFAPTGAFDRSIGREGDGPGEFRYLARLHGCHADSVFVDDIARHVFSVIGPDGTVARTFVLQTAEPGQPAYHLTCNRQGDFLTSGWGSMRPTNMEPYRPDVPVALAGPDGKVGAILGRFPGTEMMPVSGGRGAGPRRMGRWLHLAMAREMAWVAANQNADLQGFTRAGTLSLIVRTTAASRPVTKADLAWYRKSVLDSTSAGRAEMMNKALDEMIPPGSLPPVTALLADSDDHLWVQQYPEPGKARARWDVYRPDGVLLGTVSMAPGLSPVEIGADYVLGLATGEDGSRWVQLHRLRRPPAP